MRKRSSMSRSSSRSNFKRGSRVHPRNNRPTIMRGGIRL